MNERIRELEDKCWVQAPCDFDMNASGLSTIRTVFDRKKFAELIVRECIQVCKNQEYEFWRSPEDREYTPQDCADSIAEHFGVEE